MKAYAPRFVLGAALGGALYLLSTTLPAQDANATAPVNMAVVATTSSSAVSGDTTEAALNDGATPRSSRDARRGSYGNWPNRGTQWVEYEWSRPISTNRIEVYWWDDQRGVRLPKACRLAYWDGKIYGFVSMGTGAGKIIKIDPGTGAGTEVLAGAVRWYGAGVATDAPIIL